MRRSICYSEPSIAKAGETSHWKFTYTTASLLPKGTKLRFDLDSKGRDIDWQIPDPSPKAKENAIWAEVAGASKPLHPTETVHPETLTASFEFTLLDDLKIGESLSIHMGSRTGPAGNTCQKTTQRKRPFLLHIDPKGKGDYKETETFHLDVKGAELHSIRVIAPSLVGRNKRFDVVVRFEDIYGNLTSHAPEGTLIDLSYEHLRENLSWKLFVPETGFIALPNLYFNETGIYKIQLRNLQNKETFFSSPIKCVPEGSLSLYWGMLHGESPRFNSSDQIESFLRYMRDELGLQFIATSCFDSEEETSPEIWKEIIQQTSEFSEEDRFLALLGFQWVGEPKEEGVRHFLYTKEAKPILRRKETKSNSLKKIYKTHNPKEMLSIPCFTMAKGFHFDFEDTNPEFERVAEIYNAWGSSEGTEKEGNAFPIEGKISMAAEGSLIRALNSGHRFGFVAGGHDDRGCYEDLFDSAQKQYTPGLTALLAKEHTRSSLIEALQTRSCYATTGERMIVDLHIAGKGMGSELDTKTKPGLEFNRHITGYCIGTAPLEKVELLRNGKVFKTLEVKDHACEFAIDDMEPLEDVVLEGRGDKPGFVYYYLRAMQKGGQMAWGSPIWVDFSTQKKGKKR